MLLQSALRWSLSSGLAKLSSSGCLISSSLHSRTTALNAFTLKSTLQSVNLRSGSCTRRVLCIGVKWRVSSAVTLYWSSVHLVVVSQQFLPGHHTAWSDQSMAMSSRSTSCSITPPMWSPPRTRSVRSTCTII